MFLRPFQFAVFIAFVSFFSTAHATITSTASGGSWGSTTTWMGGNVPTATDDVVIASGATVTINVNASAKSLVIGIGAGASTATLQFEQLTSRTLTVSGNVTNNGTLQSNPAGTQINHLLSVGGDLTNNGVLDFEMSTGSFGVSGADLKFTGASNNTFGGGHTATRTNIRTLMIDKGSSTASQLTLEPPNFLVNGASTAGGTGSFLTLTNGTLKIAGSFTMSSRLFASASYTISTTAGLWLDNPNFTVAGQDGSPIINGLLRITDGTFNAGSAFDNELGSTDPAAVFTIEGGALNVAGRFFFGDRLTYTQTGGTVNVSTVGQDSTDRASFGLLRPVFTMSGGAINLVQASGRLDYEVDPSVTITGGVLNVGTANTVSNYTFAIRGEVPELHTDNTTNNKNAVLSVASEFFGNPVIASGTSLVLNGFSCALVGTGLTNNGAIDGSVAGSNLDFNGTVAQTYSGSGSVLGPLAILQIDNLTGLTFDPAIPQFVTLQVNLVNGGITNTNKLTIGNGGSTSATIQFGNTTTPSSPGTFDVFPTLNFGTGGLSLLYLRGTLPRATGSEITASRTLTNLTIDDTAISNDELMLSGGDLTVTGTLTLTNGRLNTGGSTVIIPASGTVVETRGAVEGNLRKTLTGTGSKTFEVGTESGYSPVAVNATAGTFPTTVTMTVRSGRHPSYQSINSLRRYWTVTTPANLAGDLMFTYFINDIGARTPANFKIAKFSNGTLSAPPSTVNTTTGTVTVAGASNPPPLSADWFVLGEADTDLDGLPDSYEKAHTTPQSSTALNPAGDADGDGLSNLSEYNSGTDPLDPTSYLHITAITKDQTGVEVTCTATDLATYRLEYKNSITDPNWIFLRFSNPHVGQPTTPIPDVTVGSSLERFYRVTLDVDDQL